MCFVTILVITLQAVLYYHYYYYYYHDYYYYCTTTRTDLNELEPDFYSLITWLLTTMDPSGKTAGKEHAK